MATCKNRVLTVSVSSVYILDKLKVHGNRLLSSKPINRIQHKADYYNNTHFHTLFGLSLYTSQIVVKT